MRTFAFVAFLAAISTPVLAINLNKNTPTLDTDRTDFYWARDQVENGGYVDPMVQDDTPPKKKAAPAVKPAPKKAPQSAKAAKNSVDTSPVNIPAAKAALDPATKVDSSKKGVRSMITQFE